MITGPTAVGKTRIAVDVAERIGAEIVSVDSRQLYRELGVAVAKPTPADMGRVPHHLVDVRSVRDPLSAGAYAREAERSIADILSRGSGPLVTGGSTLYLQALVAGIADVPPVPDDVRQRIGRRLEREGARALHRELLRVDPDFAETLDETKTQRVMRGLEVYEASGRPLSSYFDTVVTPAFDYDIVVLTRDRPDLYDRIDRRVTEMIEAGLVEETRRLVSEGFDPDANPTRTIGYPEAAAHLRGELSIDDMAALIRKNTRRYAKRQLTWFRRFERAEWIDVTGRPPGAVVDSLVRRFDA